MNFMYNIAIKYCLINYIMNRIFIATILYKFYFNSSISSSSLVIDSNFMIRISVQKIIQWTLPTPYINSSSTLKYKVLKESVIEISE